MQLVSGKIKTVELGTCDASPDLTKSTLVEVNMAKASLPILNTKSQTKRAKSLTPEYFSYQRAARRCQNPTDIRYPLYGGRGIEFRFKSFEEFFAEVGTKPSLKHSLDRIDNDGHYEPGNVRWATGIEQQRNKSTNHRITYQGETLTLVEWSERLGSRKLVTSRLRNGWCEACAVSRPRMPDGNRVPGCPHREGPGRGSLTSKGKGK